MTATLTFRRIFATLVVITSFSIPGAAAIADQDMGTVLTGRYRGQILALRHSFTARSQEYDSHGNPLTQGSEGSWTVYGRIGVTKVTVSADRLQLEGYQVMFASDKKGDPLRPLQKHDKHDNLKIAIRLDQALASEDEAVAVLGRVFALTPQEVVRSSLSLWRSYLAQQLNVSPAPGSEIKPDAGAQDKSLDMARTGFEIITDATGREKVFRIGKEVVAPRPQFTPEPEYSAIARKQRVQGTVTLDVVIDSTGKVRNVRLVHPMGMGLDEAAAETVSTWRFAPATRDGQPVPVALNIEVDFHLW
jgi:TonB family protein